MGNWYSNQASLDAVVWPPLAPAPPFSLNTITLLIEQRRGWGRRLRMAWNSRRLNKLFLSTWSRDQEESLQFHLLVIYQRSLTVRSQRKAIGRKTGGSRCWRRGGSFKSRWHLIVPRRKRTWRIQSALIGPGTPRLPLIPVKTSAIAYLGSQDK